jgi:YtfJ family uncharacterized protein
MIITLLLFVAVTPGVYGEKLTVGQTLPEVVLNGRAGELEFDGEELKYKPWNSSDLVGKVHTVYHLAARRGIDKINKRYIEMINAERLPSDKYRTVSILNIDDVSIGGRGFARRKYEERRKKSSSEFVLDDSSKVRESWGLDKKGSAVILVGKDGKVLAYKDGALKDDEIQAFINLIKINI